MANPGPKFWRGCLQVIGYNCKAWSNDIAMSIAEIISAVQALPQDEKRKVTQTLLEDPAREEPEALFQNGHVNPVHTPEFAPHAASRPSRLLAEDAKL